MSLWTHPEPVDSLVSRLQSLLDTWEQGHAGSCCTRKCVTPDGKHLDETAINQLLAYNFHLDGPLPLIDCPGTCTCGVGSYIDALRAAIHEEQN